MLVFRALILGLLFSGPFAHAATPDLGAWRANCERGDGVACGNLGAVHATGQGVPVNDALALELYEKACRLQQPARCLRAGVFALNGKGGARDVHRAADLFARGCRDGEVDACANLYLLADGQAIQLDGSALPLPAGTLAPKVPEPDLRQVRTALEASCGMGVAKSCGNLGLMLESGRHLPADPPAALRSHERACELGVGPHCARAAIFLLNGVGASENPARAAELLRKGCERKDAGACLLEGRVAAGQVPKMPPLGGGAPQPERQPPPTLASVTAGAIPTVGLAPELAASVAACNEGDARACGNAAAQLIDPQGIPTNPPVAFALMERACALGRAQRCAQLEGFYANGWGTARSSAKAAESRARACRLGLATACPDDRRPAAHNP